MRTSEIDNNMDNIEKLFYNEVREKKRTATGSFHMRGKGKKHGIGKVVFPSDYLTTREKKKLNGVVIVSNVFDDINNVPSMDEIINYDFEKAKKVLTAVKERHPNAALMKHWDIKSPGSLYGYFYKYGVVERGVGRNKRRQFPNLPKEKKEEKKESKTMEEEKDETPTQITIFDINELHKQLKHELEAIREGQKKETGFTISINGEYDQEEATNRIMNILQTLIKEKKYSINLDIKEL